MTEFPDGEALEPSTRCGPGHAELRRITCGAMACVLLGALHNAASQSIWTLTEILTTNPSLIGKAHQMKQTLLRRLLVLSACAMFSVSLTGCIASIGGGKDRVTTVQSTKGQELIDLQSARDKGAITPEEFENQRKLILQR